MMTDWVHCNTCFNLPGSGKRFLLTSCGHIYCNDCVFETQMNCQICGNSCTTIQLTTQMKPDVEIYFMDPQDLLKKYMKQLLQVINFQNGHRMRLSAYYKQEMAKIKKTKEELKKNFSHFKDLEKQNSTLRAENSYLKELLSPKPKTNFMVDVENLNKSNCIATMKSDSNIQKNYQRSYGDHQSRKSSNLVESINCSRTSMPTRVTVRTPPINGHIGIIQSTPQSYTRSVTPSSNQRLLSSCISASPTFMTPSTPKLLNERTLYSSPKSNSSLQNSFKTPIYQNNIIHSGLTQDFSGKMSLNASTKELTMIHKPIQLKQEFRHPGLIRKAKVLPYSPDKPNDDIRNEE